ncbi:MAG: alpha/beta hydrolase [Candidatus Acidiferrales bacterium]
MTTALHRSFFLAGPAGRLEAQLWTAPQPRGSAVETSSAPPMATIVCHPHPLHGGTMHNKVVFHAARTLNRLGLPVLRFNFRGAGLSDGVHDRGRGEADDVRAALDWLAGEYAGRPLLLAGFSFGAWVGLRVGCADARVSHLVGLGIPVNSSSHDYLRQCAKPKLFLHGRNDEHGDPAVVESLVASFPGANRLALIDAADHFFTDRLDQMTAALRDWTQSQMQEI